MRILLLFIFAACSFALGAQETEQGIVIPTPKKVIPTPMIQLAVGNVYSSIDLSRYISSVAYKGHHFRAVTHIKGMTFFSVEYSKFKTHDSPSAWKDIDTRKFDFNGHVSFATHNNLTRIYALAGANKHEWHATRTGFTDQSQLGVGILEGTRVNIHRWGVNFGCGFTQTLYENIGIFGDYRFCLSRVQSFEKVRILDVMTTIGINISFPHPEYQKGTSIRGKLYKWTKKGA